MTQAVIEKVQEASNEKEIDSLKAKIDSLTERVELTAERQIIIRFRFRQLEADP